MGKLDAMRAESRREGGTSAVNTGAAITAYVGEKKKKKEDEKKTKVAETEKVDAAAIEAKRLADEEQYKKNREKNKNKSAIEIAMGGGS